VNAHIDRDDLAMLGAGFVSAMSAGSTAGDVAAAMFDLGWAELLTAAPGPGAATAFSALGTTGSSVGLIDDVVLRALGVDLSPTTCIVLPAPHQSDPPATRRAGHLHVDGLVSSRFDTAEVVMIAVADGDEIQLARVTDRARHDPSHGIDPDPSYRRRRCDIPLDDVDIVSTDIAWDHAVAAARIALSHQLIAGARWMLAAAREHALERVQFGRPVASFQAVRHKLAESLVAIEAAASVADAATAEEVGAIDPLLPALAKSLAGTAARTTSTHAQQVLAGIGFTTDHDFQRWMKRTMVVETVCGSAATLPTEIGRMLLARGGAPRLLDL